MWLKNLRDRLLFGFLLFALVIVVVVCRGWVFGVAVSIFALISQLEMFGALRAASFRPGVWPGVAMAVLMYPMYCWKGLAGLFAMFAVFCLVLIANSVLLPRRRFLDTMVSVFAMIYPCFFYIFLLLLNDISRPGFSAETAVAFSRVALGAALVGTIASDVGAYFCGHFFGRHKLAPQISPKKTVEGAVGAIICSVLVLSVAGYFAQRFYFPQMPLYHYPLLGIMVSVLAQAGDLMASSIKRFSGIKDFSSLLPGHGGFMDRMDSILFGSVAAYCYLELFFF